MAELSDAEKTRILWDIEAIRKLKHKYWRCNDLKLMDEMSECFTEDATADYGPGIQLQGREAIIEFLRNNVGRADLISIHQGFNEEIEIIGETRAEARWRFYNYMDFSGAGMVMRIWATYHDEYVKDGAEWKIVSTRVDYALTETATSSRGLGQVAGEK